MKMDIEGAELDVLQRLLDVDVAGSIAHVQGLVAANLLTAGRPPIMFTRALLLRQLYPNSVLDKCMALSLHLFNVSTQVKDVPEHIPFTVALLLVLVVLSMNSVAIYFRMKLRGTKKW